MDVGGCVNIDGIGDIYNIALRITKLDQRWTEVLLRAGVCGMDCITYAGGWM